MYRGNDKGSFSITGCQQKLLCVQLHHHELLLKTQECFGGVLTCSEDLLGDVQFNGAVAGLFVCEHERQAYMHLPVSEHMNKRLCYGPMIQFT